MDLTVLLQTIALGIIQGLTEFIPVSSSGHLEVIPQLFNWQPLSTTLILFAHLGTLIAVLIYFRVKLLGFVKSMYYGAKSKIKKDKVPSEDQANLRLIALVLITSIPAGLFGLLLQDKIEEFYIQSSGASLDILLTLLAMFALGLVFINMDRFPRAKKVDLEKLPYGKAVAIGLSQALALVRGVSRSGITLFTGELLGLNRVQAAELAFLMSIPLLLATSALGLWDLVKSPMDSAIYVQAAIITGVSFASGMFAIRFMLNYLKKAGLKVFGYYRVFFVMICLLVIFLGS